jgi:hypothetical protein
MRDDDKLLMGMKGEHTYPTSTFFGLLRVYTRAAERMDGRMGRALRSELSVDITRESKGIEQNCLVRDRRINK